MLRVYLQENTSLFEPIVPARLADSRSFLADLLRLVVLHVETLAVLLVEQGLHARTGHKLKEIIALLLLGLVHFRQLIFVYVGPAVRNHLVLLFRHLLILLVSLLLVSVILVQTLDLLLVLVDGPLYILLRI